MATIAVICEKGFLENNSNIGNKFSFQIMFIGLSLTFFVISIIVGLIGKIYCFNFNFAKFFTKGCLPIYFSFAMVGAYFIYKYCYFKNKKIQNKTTVTFSQDSIVINYIDLLITEVIPYSDVINYSKSDTKIKIHVATTVLIFNLSYLTVEQIVTIEECLSEFSEQFAINQKFKKIKALKV